MKMRGGRNRSPSQDLKAFHIRILIVSALFVAFARPVQPAELATGILPSLSDLDLPLKVTIEGSNAPSVVGFNTAWMFIRKDGPFSEEVDWFVYLEPYESGVIVYQSGALRGSSATYAVQLVAECFVAFEREMASEFVHAGQSVDRGAQWTTRGIIESEMFAVRFANWEAAEGNSGIAARYYWGKEYDLDRMTRNPDNIKIQDLYVLKSAFLLRQLGECLSIRVEEAELTPAPIVPTEVVQTILWTGAQLPIGLQWPETLFHYRRLNSEVGTSPKSGAQESGSQESAGIRVRPTQESGSDLETSGPRQK